jgi:hypothetical protein
MIFKISLFFCDSRVSVKTLQHSLNCQRDQDQIQDSATVGTNCRPQNSQPAGYWELDLSVWRQIRCPLRNNLLQGQRSPQALLLVTQLARFASRKRRHNGQEVEQPCSKDPLFALRIDLFSFDDSINSYRYSSAFIPRATPLLVNSLSISKPMPRDAPSRICGKGLSRNKLTRCEISDS